MSNEAATGNNPRSKLNLANTTLSETIARWIIHSMRKAARQGTESSANFCYDTVGFPPGFPCLIYRAHYLGLVHLLSHAGTRHPKSTFGPGSHGICRSK